MGGEVTQSRQHSVPAAGYDSEFVSVYREYYTRIFAFVYSRVRDVEVAKDIVSEVFERAYVHGGSVRKSDSYSSWLFMVARNSIAGHFRKKRRESEANEKTRDGLMTWAGPPEPCDFAIKGETAQALLRHLRTLPQRDQEIISLKFDGELTNAEVAHILGMHPVNVRVALFRALRRLRDRMEAESQLGQTGGGPQNRRRQTASSPLLRDVSRPVRTLQKRADC